MQPVRKSRALMLIGALAVFAAVGFFSAVALEQPSQLSSSDDLSSLWYDKIDPKKELKEQEKENKQAAKEEEKSLKEAEKNAGKSQQDIVLGLFESESHSYIPALNYIDPCDVDQESCCTDPSFPILGGMDLVHFHLTGHVVFGSPRYFTRIVGSTRMYTTWFSQVMYQTLFERDPLAYLPVDGGFYSSEFCSPDMTSLSPVDLSLATKDANGYLTFDPNFQQEDICPSNMSNLLGIPSKEIFNTRCISMAGLSSDVLGLVEQNAVPIKRSVANALLEAAEKADSLSSTVDPLSTLN